MIIFISGCQNKNSSEIIVAAAASLTDVASELKALYEIQNPNVKISFTYGSSGTLQAQIEEGAPIDVFISASEKQIDSLKQKNLILENSTKYIAENEIVLIVPKSSDKNIKSFNDLTNNDITSIAIGDVSSVPVGQYSYDILTKMNILDNISSKLIYASDVRQVLTWVETSQADCGIVYATDAFISDKVEIKAYADKNFTVSILYPATVIKNSKNIDESQKFTEFLKSDEALKIFEKYGFKRVD